jgi:hypothetical protein
MKNDSTTTFLNFVLAALVILSVFFAVLTIWRERDLQQLTSTVAVAQNNLGRADALLKDAAAYNAVVKNPELGRIIEATQPKNGVR